MKNYLLVGVAVIVVAFAANQVMSEPVPVPDDREQAARPKISIEQVKNFRDALAGSVHAQGESRDEDSSRDTELLAALDRYLAKEQLSKIVVQLEEFVKHSASTPEAQKAAAAIAILKGDDMEREFNRQNFGSSIVRPRPGSARPTRIESTEEQ